MKKIIIIGLVLFLCIQHQVNGQNQKLIDSLETVLKNSKQDTSCLRILYKLYVATLHNDSAKAMEYALQYHSIAKENGYLKGEAEALNNIGLIHQNYGNYLEAMAYFRKAIAIFETTQDKTNMHKVYGNIGNSYYLTGNLPEALNYYELSIKINEEVGDLSGKAGTYSNIAHIYKTQGELNDAIQTATKSINIYTKLADSSNIARVWNLLGSIFLEMGNYPESLKYYLSAMKINEKGGNKVSLCALYINIGNLYYYMENYTLSMQYYDTALKIASEAGIKSHLALVLSNIANIYAEEDKFDDALDYYLSGLKINQEIGDKSGMANAYSAMGKLYWDDKNTPEALRNYYISLTLFEEIGEKKSMINLYNNIGDVYLEQKKYSEANNLAKKALALSKETGFLSQTEHSYMLLSQLDSAQGNYKRALENHKLYIATRDSIMNEENTEKITRQQMQFDFDKQNALTMAEQEKKDALMREEIHHHRVIGNLYLIIGSSIIAIAILLLILFRQKAHKKKVIADQKIRQLEEEKKLLAARFLVEGEEKERKRIAQDLHDGLGVLLSVTRMHFSQIASASAEIKPLIDKAAKFLEQASGDVRRISHNMMPGLLTKLGLFEALEDLLEKITDSDKIEAVCEISGNKERLPENKEIMLYRVVQEMVNNTVKYAEATKIDLQIEILSDQVILRYADNGKGFKADDSLMKESMGLQSIKSRVSFLDGKIQLDSAPGKGTRYNVEIPL